MIQLRARPARRDAGFTLVEVMVTLVIVGIIMVSVAEILRGARYTRDSIHNIQEKELAGPLILQTIENDLRSLVVYDRDPRLAIRIQNLIRSGFDADSIDFVSSADSLLPYRENSGQAFRRADVETGATSGGSGTTSAVGSPLLPAICGIGRTSVRGARRAGRARQSTPAASVRGVHQQGAGVRRSARAIRRDDGGLVAQGEPDGLIERDRGHLLLGRQRDRNQQEAEQAISACHCGLPRGPGRRGWSRTGAPASRTPASDPG